MDSICLLLLVHTSVLTAIPVLSNTPGKFIMGPEEVVTDFATMTGDDLDNLPPDFTICSSMSATAFTSGLSPFQLLYQETKKPWITLYFYGALMDSKFHRMTFFVSFRLNQCPKLNMTLVHFSGGQYQHCLCEYRHPFGFFAICLASYLCFN